MMTYEDARKIGINACVDKLGREFVKQYRDSACSAYGDIEDHAYCFVGVSDSQERKWDGEDIILDGNPGSEFPYRASCNVWYVDGKVEFIECVLPMMTEQWCDQIMILRIS